MICLVATLGAAAATLNVTADGSLPTQQGWSVFSSNTTQANQFNGVNTNPDFNGIDSGCVVTGPPAWGLFANSGSFVVADYTFPMLMTGVSVSIGFDNGDNIDSGRDVGIRLYESGTGSDILFQYSFTGGESLWEVTDATRNGHATSTGFSRDGFIFNFTLGAGGNFQFNDGISSFSGQLGSSAMTVDRIQVFNNSAGNGNGSNVIFNSMALETVPEPTTLALLASGSGLLLWRRLDTE